MPSTRRTDAHEKPVRRIAGRALGTWLVAGGVAIGVAWIALAAPSPPTSPRYGAAGSAHPRHGGTFVFHHESNIRSLDPAIAYDEISQMALRLLFDGLLDYDEHGQMVASLAEAMPEQSEDGRTFTFRLRRNVRFHNGRELVAEDVRWTMERLLSAETASPGWIYFSQLDGLDEYRAGEAQHIRGIRVRDRRTVEFHLKEPDQTFLNAIAMPFAYPLPREHYEDPNVEPRTMPCGTGPFTLRPEDWERGVRAVFERNPDYWNQPEPWPDRMVYLENINRTVAVMRFRNGDLDALHRFSPADYLFFKHAPAWRPYWTEDPKVTLWGIEMNTRMAPFDDVHVRRAVALAVDRAGWNRARSGRMRLTGQPIPPPLLGYDEHLPGLQHTNLDEARREMAAAGHPVRRVGDRWVAAGLENDEIEFWVGENDTGRQYGEMAQADLAKIGLKIRIRQVAFTTYLDETGKPDRVRTFLGGWNMDFPDPSNFLDVLFHSHSIAPENSNNRTFYSNPEVDALLDRARVERDHDERGRLYREAQMIIVRDAPWAFMWNDLWLEAWQPYVRDYHPNPVWSQDYRDLWLDLPKRRLAERFVPRGPRAALAALFPFGGR